MELKAKDRLILALDVLNMEAAIPLLDQLQGKVGMVKVNSLASACPEIIQEIKSRGLKVWRDWKHHDIPGTVVNFIKADVDAGIDMCTVHTSGGSVMMFDAAAKRTQEKSNLKILGITVLTSIDKQEFNEEMGISGEIQDTAVRWALLAEKAHLDGVVASAKEAPMLRKVLKPGTLIVTPGITPNFAVKREDQAQARVTTPKQAILNGADKI
ncbi:MAG: orotidine-5'-phosphate decarboxylase, partial [Candidatus Pacebacteria bacterium]|nr:orotidine-5'-phosphate decarboxylase [Candidatus Paceibacterota bacterium]